MAENIENKGFAVYNAETNWTGDEAMDAKTRKNIEYLIILLISAAMLAAGWSNRKIIAGWGNQNTEDAAEKEDLILEINSVEDYLTFVRSVNKGNTYRTVCKFECRSGSGRGGRGSGYWKCRKYAVLFSGNL